MIYIQLNNNTPATMNKVYVVCHFEGTQVNCEPNTQVVTQIILIKLKFLLD